MGRSKSVHSTQVFTLSRVFHLDIRQLPFSVQMHLFSASQCIDALQYQPIDLNGLEELTVEPITMQQ
jgi:hypothetical protein